MNADTETQYKIAPEWGDVAESHKGIIHPYWLQFAPPENYVNLALGIFIGIVAIISIIGNGLVAFVFLRSEALRRMKLFTTNLVISDLLSALLTYHLFVVSSFNDVWSFSKRVCELYAMAQGIFGLVSIASLAAVAVERHAMITNPDSCFSNMSYKRKFLIISLIWLYCTLAVIPPMFGIGNYFAAGFNTTCCFDYITRDWKTRAFIIYMFTLGLIIPMTIVFIAYLRIYFYSKREANEFMEVVEEAGWPEQITFAVAEPTGPGPSPRHRSLRKDLRMARLSAQVIGIFVMAWTPYGVVALLGQFGPVGIISPWMAMVPSMLAKSSVLYNPLLYSYADPRFIRAFRKHVLRDKVALTMRTVSLTSRYTRKSNEGVIDGKD